MRLQHAIRHVQRMVDQGTLTGVDAIAVHCLVQLAKKVLRVQVPIRQLERAICPKEELNQTSLFEESEPDVDSG